MTVIGTVKNNNEQWNVLVFVHFRAFHMQSTSGARQFNPDRISTISCFRFNLFFFHKMEPLRGFNVVFDVLSAGRWHLWCNWEKNEQYVDMKNFQWYKIYGNSIKNYVTNKTIDIRTSNYLIYWSLDSSLDQNTIEEISWRINHNICIQFVN